jgi:hypothetical protein
VSRRKYSLADHPEHRAQLDGWAQRWIANAMSTEPANRPAMREAMAGLYLAAGLEPPPEHRGVFVGSPMTAAIAGTVAAGVWWLREHPDEHVSLFGRRVSDADVMAAIGPACAVAVRAGMAALRGESATRVTDAATDDATDDATANATSAATDAATSAATFAATWAATDDATSAATDAATRTVTWAATWAATEAATDDATDAATDDATDAATSAAADAATVDATVAATDAVTWAATRRATFAATRAATGAAIRAPILEATRAATGAATRAATAAATFAATFAATDDETGAATRAETRDATRAATVNATDADTRAATWAATAPIRAPIRAATADETAAATAAATRAATAAATDAATSAAADAATRDATWAATRDATWAATEAATDAATVAATAAVTWAATRDAVVRFLLQCVPRWHRMHDGGSDWSAWPAYLSFFRHIARLALPEYEQWRHYEAAALHGASRIMHRRFWIVADRHSEVHVDRDRRLHCETGPARSWRDGWAVWAWHGVRVPKAVIDGTWSIDRILRERNAEVRRCAVEALAGRRGWAHVIEAAGWPEVGDPVPDPANPGHMLRLYKVDGVFGEPVTLLHCVNATPERDGTRREFGLTCPGHMRDPLQAAAWTFGLSRDEYAQLQHAY